MKYEELTKEQGKDLNYKIMVSDMVIEDAMKRCKHRVAIAYSGGKDSTVLWYRIRKLMERHPEWAGRIVIIFGNTGSLSTM